MIVYKKEETAVTKRSIYRGCLLGLAVGDAMGCGIDERSFDEIQEDYGPGGLRGYDLVNGYADVSSHTQLAAFTCNGLLLAMTRGQLRGAMAPLSRYIALAQKEWMQGQRHFANRNATRCWVYQHPVMRQRRCMDTRMLETLSMEAAGTLEEPLNRYVNPGSLTTAIPVGLFGGLNILPPEETLRLAAESVALTSGGQKAFLSGAILAGVIQMLTEDPRQPMKKVFTEAANRVREQFGGEYPQVEELCNYLRHALSLADQPQITAPEAMDRLECKTAGQVLAGVAYACVACNRDFDAAMIIAVNHSGRSSAVAALTGAILGAALGEEEIQNFYLDCLEPVSILRTLADDLLQGCPMDRRGGIFDDDWNQKYVHGGV